MRPLRAILILILFISIFQTGVSQQLNYITIFGSDWEKAQFYIEENNSWIKPAVNKYEIPYAVAVSVVFPELVRYSALRDKMEITMLKTLYRNLGDDYADFSIGFFQIKPSFAEKIRGEMQAFPGWRAKPVFKKRSAYKNDREYRGAIIADLENPKKEFNYIIAFLRICEKYFPLETADEGSRIKFLATAYNTGFWKSKDEIDKMSNMKFFNTKLFSTENYSYADVSLFWYKQYIQKKNKQ
ncbi:MAG: hypothetical protein NT092_10650 [Bacteroidia bacterium]|nr:hypothetical protein [Bacteroidia bacterium]